jgi:uncharacterized membrane protein (UPF0136 family)
MAMIVAGGLLVLTAAFPLHAAPLHAAAATRATAGVMLLDLATLGLLVAAAIRMMTPRTKPAPVRRREP